MRRAFALACATAASGCALFGHVVEGAFEKPRLTFRGLEPRRATLSELELDVVLEVDNPNSMGVTIARGQIELSLEGKRLATLQPSHVVLPARSKTPVRIPARLQYLDVASGALSFHHQRAAHYEAAGSIGLDTPVGIIDLPISQKGELPLPAIPDVQPVSARVKRADLMGVELDLTLALRNPNPVPLWLDGLEGKLLLSGAEIGRIASPDLGELAPGATRELTLPVQVTLANAPALLVALAQGDVQLRFEGTLRSGEARVPLTLDSVLKRH